MEATLLFGGDKIYYVNDQCQFLGVVGQGSEGDYTWEELEKYIFEKVGHNMVSISDSFGICGWFQGFIGLKPFTNIKPFAQICAQAQRTEIVISVLSSLQSVAAESKRLKNKALRK